MQSIAVPIEEDRGLESPVSSHFGDGKHYLLVDVKDLTTDLEQALRGA